MAFQVEIPLSVHYDDKEFATRIRVLNTLGYQAASVFSVSANRLPLEVIDSMEWFE
jgi:hypothetical protein